MFPGNQEWRRCSNFNPRGCRCNPAHWPCPRLCVFAIGPKFPLSGIRMIEMNRNDVGLFRRDGRCSLRDAAPRNQPGNRHLRPDDGNRGIDRNMWWLVHGEILRHFSAVGAGLDFRRGGGIPILFVGLSFSHGNLQLKTTGHLTRIEAYHLPDAFPR